MVGHMPRIMVVDDDPDIRAAIAHGLEKAGYEVTSAPDGLEALLLMRENPPDALLTDVLMPKADGWELIRSCRADPNLAHVRVLVMSGVPSMSDVAARQGTQGFLLKPFVRRVNRRMDTGDDERLGATFGGSGPFMSARHTPPNLLPAWSHGPVDAPRQRRTLNTGGAQRRVRTSGADTAAFWRP